MNKVILTIICVIVVIGAIFTAIEITKLNDNKIEENVVEKVSDSEILDECTDEYEILEKNDMLQANSEEEKISPNCSFTVRKYYEGCGHTTSEYLELPEDLVNDTKEDIQEKYKDYKIDKFASNEIILLKQNKGECGEHYIVKDRDGQVVVYNIQEDGTEKEYEVTDITTEYLTDTDKVNMKNGIRVNGKQSLNQLIEDFE
ncbi:MAG: hypothetical protein HFJ40_07980 [Clostridia bacterium]|nr:hypothetical protein [Clostridia bacterium]